MKMQSPVLMLAMKEMIRMSAKSEKITMSIDVKKHRIRIHRNTLHALNDPDRIQLLLHPAIPAILIRSPQLNEPFGQTEKVVFDKPGNSGTFQMYSMELIQRIQRRYPVLKDGMLYRLVGRYRPDLCAACFPLPAESHQGEPDNEVKRNADNTDDRPGIQIHHPSAE